MAGEPKPSKNLRAMSSDERKEVYEYFQRSRKKAGGLSKTDNFKEYDASRISGIDGFSKIKAPDGSTISEKLKTPAAEKPRGSLNDVFEKSPDYQKAGKACNEDLANLNTLLKEGKCTLTDAAAYLLEAKGTAVKAIKAQQAQEKDNLTKLFEDKTFKGQMQTSLGCSEAELNSIKNEMLSTLTKSHGEELKKFQKSLEDSANELFKRAEKEYFRLTFLGHRNLLFKNMREEMDRIAKLSGSEPGPSTVESGKTGSARLKNVDPSKLAIHVTVSGDKLEVSQGGGLTKRFGTWFLTDSKVYDALTSIAQDLKAQGADAMTFEIQDSDPKRAEEIGRKAYESAIVAGFDPKKITIKINGEVKYKHDEKGNLEKGSDLFNRYGERLKAAEQKSTLMAEKRERLLKSEGNISKLKSSLRDLRSKESKTDDATAAKAPVAAGPGGSGH